MNIAEMTLEEIEVRSAEIVGLLEGAEGETLAELKAETDALLERKAELEAIETRTAQAEALTEGKVEPDTVVEIVKTEERKMFNRESTEYRDAFMAMLVNKATPEQRAIVADGTNYGDGLALPVATDTAIWDQVLTQHPVLSDVAMVKSGVVMKVTQMTPSNLGTSTGVKGKKDSEAVVELTFTGTDKVLAGKDYTTYVTLTYAEAKMSAGAMEQFLVNEIANALGELLAKDVFASVLTDAVANEVTKTGTYYEAIGAALGKATQAVNPVIYAPSALYYAILKEVDQNGQPIVREGVVLGAEIKKDNAATKITIMDPNMYVKNMYSRSDKKGRFGLTNVQPDDTIHVIYRKTEYFVPVEGRHSIRIHLGDQLSPSAEEDQNLVNWGYGFVKRRESIDVSSGISGEELIRTGRSDVLSALQGRVPGLNIGPSYNGKTTSVTIRGINSLNLPLEPLYIVDGVEVETLDYVSVYDVDHVEVLKDASIYGNRGANGAILVTTKRGGSR